MNALICKVVLFVLKKYKEPSTWIPITAAIGTYLHANVSPELTNAIDLIFSSIVGALFLAINERNGPNPDNAPRLPDGTVPVVVAADHGDAAKLQPPAVAKPVDLPTAAGPELQPRSRADLPVAERGNDPEFHGRIRPGFPDA